MSANQQSIADWNGESGERWAAAADERDRGLAAVADVLLEAARLSLGEAVLDIGCGCGATSIAAASAVAPGGSVVGVDVSGPMLEVARRRVSAVGIPGVELVQADVQTHAFRTAGFDAAISRFGTMFFDDPGAAFRNVADALRPGGRLCIVTWQPLVANDWLTVPGAAILRHGGMLDPDEAGPRAPGMFAQSEPDVVRDLLGTSGFGEVAVEGATVSIRLGDDPDGATRYLAGTGIGRAALASVPDDERDVALDAVRDALADHVRDGEVQLEGAVLVTTAAKV